MRPLRIWPAACLTEGTNTTDTVNAGAGDNGVAHIFMIKDLQTFNALPEEEQRRILIRVIADASKEQRKVIAKAKRIKKDLL